jgi:hypothetical protein
LLVLGLQGEYRTAEVPFCFLGRMEYLYHQNFSIENAHIIDKLDKPLFGRWSLGMQYQL